MPKYAFVILAVIILSAGVLVVFNRTGNPSGQYASVIGGIKEGDHSKGSQSPKVTIVEYSDFQCPACAAFYPLLKRVSEEYAGEVAVVYRHFPLRQIHINAEFAARASEAAGIQGKFWEMHDSLFEHQKEWAESLNAKALFSSYAVFLGLDVGKFNADFDSAAVVAKVENDYRSGLAAAINATPTFFLNGKKMQNPRSYEEFKKAVNEILGKNN